MSLEIDPKLLEVAKRLDVAPEAICLILHCLHGAAFHRQGHCSGESLCWLIHDTSIRQYGSEARAQLSEWGIVSTEKIGEIVFALADERLITKSEDDRPQDFVDVFDFADAFIEPHFQAPALFGRWTIGGLFVATTVIAIAIPGVKKNGFAGGIGTLAGAWFALIGTICLAIALMSNFRGRFLAWAIGVVFLVMGLVTYWATSTQKLHW